MAKAGIHHEFVELLAVHQKLIHSVCNLYFTMLEDRKDMFQEIVLQLWRSYPTFDNRSKVSTWIYRVALNTVLAKLRRNERKPDNEPLSDNTTQIAEPEDSLLLTEATQELYRAISQLGDLDKAIIILYLEEYSYDEIGVILGLSRTNVSTRINRIKLKLKGILQLDM